MTHLAIASTVIGGVTIAGRLPGVFAPDQFSDFARKFPRSVIWGRVLAAIAALWAAIIMYNAAVDDFAWLKPIVVIGMPIAYWLVIQFADQFLAIRAQAALLLLVAKVVLNAADLSDQPSRLVITVLAYLWVCAAIWMASAPHQVRDVIGFITAKRGRCRISSLVGVVFGVVLVVLGLCVY